VLAVTRVQWRHSIRAPDGNSVISQTAHFRPFIFLNFNQSKKKCTFETGMVKNRNKVVGGGGVTKICFYGVLENIEPEL
jgi:hypothetical protein